MDSKFIVFFRHRVVRDAIEKKLINMKVKYICIAGDVVSGLRPVCLSLMYSAYCTCTSYALCLSGIPWSWNVPFS